MAGKSAVTLRLGVEGDEKIQAALRKIGQTGDQAFAGLSKEAKEAARSFDRLEKSVDAQARSAAQVARAYVSANQAIAQGDLRERRAAGTNGALDVMRRAASLARYSEAGATQGGGVSFARCVGRFWSVERWKAFGPLRSLERAKLC